jgi:hypothetical protein
LPSRVGEFTATVRPECGESRHDGVAASTQGDVSFASLGPQDTAQILVRIIPLPPQQSSLLLPSSLRFSDYYSFTKNNAEYMQCPE